MVIVDRNDLPLRFILIRTVLQHGTRCSWANDGSCFHQNPPPGVFASDYLQTDNPCPCGSGISSSDDDWWKNQYSSQSLGCCVCAVRYACHQFGRYHCDNSEFKVIYVFDFLKRRSDQVSGVDSVLPCMIVLTRLKTSRPKVWKLFHRLRLALVLRRKWIKKCKELLRGGRRLFLQFFVWWWENKYIFNVMIISQLPQQENPYILLLLLRHRRCRWCFPTSMERRVTNGRRPSLEVCQRYTSCYVL